MTDQNALSDLHQITQARYAERQQRFAKVLEEEATLRAELARLDAMSQETDQAQTPTTGMRALGADVIWRGWLERTKTALNLQLARVLATKEHHLTEVRQAYGKVLVIEEMQTELRQDTLKRQANASLERAISHSLHGTR